MAHLGHRGESQRGFPPPGKKGKNVEVKGEGSRVTKQTGGEGDL